MDVLGDLLDRDRRSDHLALRTPDGRERSYHELLTNAYKAGNALRHRGLRRGTRIGVAPIPGFHPVLAFLGAGLLGAATRFHSEPNAGDEIGFEAPRVLFVPVADEERYDPAPETKLVAFGGEPVRSTTTHWETEMWSENPGFPPTEATPDDPLLSTATESRSHRSVLDAARTVADRVDLDGDDVVVLRESPSDPRAAVAGLVAPLLVGGAIALVDEPTSASREDGSSASREDGSSSAPQADESRGTIAVCEADVATVPESKRLSPRDVPL